MNEREGKERKKKKKRRMGRRDEGERRIYTASHIGVESRSQVKVDLGLKLDRLRKREQGREVDEWRETLNVRNIFKKKVFRRDLTFE